MADEPYPVGTKVYVTYTEINRIYWTQDEPGIVVDVAGPRLSADHIVYTIVFLEGSTITMSARGVSDKKNASEYSRNIDEHRRQGREYTRQGKRRPDGEPV